MARKALTTLVCHFEASGRFQRPLPQTPASTPSSKRIATTSFLIIDETRHFNPPWIVIGRRMSDLPTLHLAIRDA